MSESNSACDKRGEQNPLQNRRQEGDGNDSATADALVNNAPLTAQNGFNLEPDLVADREENVEEKIEETTEVLSKGSVSVGTEQTIGKISFQREAEAASESFHVRSISSESEKKKIAVSLESQLSPSPNWSLSQKELRQQLRQLHSQELIRRILQSSPKVNNFVSPQSLIDTQEPNGERNPVEFQERPSKPTFYPQDAKSPLKLNNLEQEQANRKEHQEKQISLLKQTEGEKTVAAIPAMQSADQNENMLEACSCQQSPGTALKSNTNEVQQFSVPNDSVQSDSITSVDSGSTGILDSSQVTFVERSRGTGTKQENDSVVQPTSKATQQNSQEYEAVDFQQLREKMSDKPTQETLSEILRLLQAQNNSELQSQQESFKGFRPSNSHQPAMALSTFDNSGDSFSGVNSGGPQPGAQSMQTGRYWNPVHPWQLMQQNAMDMHARQVSDLRSYYESEITTLNEQLEHLRGNISSLQEAMPIKMLETANVKLEGRCHLLEEICNELQAKCKKYEKSNQELEVSCRQLSRANQNLEVRCLHLEQANETLNTKQLNLSSNRQDLESNLLEMKTVNEKAAMIIQEQQQVHKDAEMKYLQLEDTRNRLESKYKRYKEQNQTLEQDIKHMQESLVSSTRHSEELEMAVSALNTEKDDWKLKLDAAHKVAAAANQRLEEMKSHYVKREKAVEQLQEQVKQLSHSLDKTNKTKVSMDDDSRRDKELLQKLLAEFDALSNDYKASRMSSQSLEQKLNESQDEVSELRGQVQKIVQRNLSLEESLRETIGHINSSSPVQTRKKWTTAVNWTGSTVGKVHNHDSGVDSALESQGAQMSGVLKTSPEKPSNTSRLTTGLPNITDEPFTPTSLEWKTSTPLKPDRSTSKQAPSKGKSTKSPKKNLEKSFSPYSAATNHSKSPGNMVVKQSDLVTRFDVLFEDSESGKEATRTHIGHSRRLYGNAATGENSSVTREVPKQQESAVTSVVERLGISDTERALNAIRAGRVTSFEDWENQGTVMADSNAQKRTAKLYFRNCQNKVASSVGKGSEQRGNTVTQQDSSEECFVDDNETVVSELERKFSRLMEERKRLESTLSRIPSSRMTKRTKEDKVFLENRLDEVVKGIGSVRMQLRRYNAL